MTGYEYGNARLRVMKSRLLTKKEIETLIQAGSLQGLIAALTKTNYRRPVEAALARTSGMDCIAEALRVDLISTIGKIQSFYRERSGKMVAIVLRTYDIANLKAILRGLSKNASPDEILATTLPVSDLSYDTLNELASASRPRVAIDLLASMGSPFAQPLIRLRTEHPGADILEMELALEQWHYREAKQYLQSEFQTDGLLYSALNLHADLSNLLTLLRFVHSPSERNQLREKLGTENIKELFSGPGRLSFSLLAEAENQDSVEAAVETLIKTPYESPLQSGLEAFARTGKLSEFEKHLQRFRLKSMSNLITKDPLGIGVVLGYVALKTNEVNNVRWIAQGINLGLKSDAIRSEVEFIE